MCAPSPPPAASPRAAAQERWQGDDQSGSCRILNHEGTKGDTKSVDENRSESNVRAFTLLLPSFASFRGPSGQYSRLEDYRFKTLRTTKSSTRLASSMREETLRQPWPSPG